MSQRPLKKIVIIGLGFMGGSLAATIQRKIPSAKIIGVARRQPTLQTAKKMKWIHEGFLEVHLKQALVAADLVIICTPVDLTQKYLAEIDRAASSEIFVTDIGSVQNSDPLKAARKNKWKYVDYIGAHPMVGSHEKGIKAAKTGLYDNGLTIITGQKKQPAFETVFQFWKKLSGRVVEMPPERHDELVAQISHMPHLLSTCLVLAASKPAFKIASTGFRDTTRLAEGPASVWTPIFMQNKKSVLKAIKSFNSNLKQLQSAMISGDKVRLDRLLTKAANLRIEWTQSHLKKIRK